MARWFKILAVNGLLVAASTMLAYVAVEFLFFRVILSSAHMTTRPFLPETAGTLVQTTKAAYVPRNYVAILGDSYGQGLGDEAVKAGYDEGRWFHAANVVHELTGRDIVTFAKAGAGSAEAFVLLPSRVLNGSRCALFPTIEDPAQVYAYFYEGNDLADNLRFLTRVRAKYGRADASDIDAYLSDQFASYPWWRCHAQLGDVASRLARFAYAEYTGELNVAPELPWRAENLRIGEDLVAVPPLEGPAIGLGGNDIEAALAVFDRSLAWLHNRFPHAAITVVYIASPLALYHHAAPDVGYDGYGMRAEQILPRSRQICGLVRAASIRMQVGFLDTGPALREAASIQAIHGPSDWHHFNAKGYRILGTALALRLPEPTKVDDCG